MPDLSTIDTAAFSALNEGVCPNSPVIRHVPERPVPPATNSPGPVIGLVTDELVRSCVTPRKVAKVRQALDAGETDRRKCAIKLLQQFFTKEELAAGNTEGNFNKNALDRTRLHSLKGKLL